MKETQTSAEIKKGRYKEYPESDAVSIWEKEGLIFSIVQQEEMGHYCGYVRFPKRPVKGTDCEGFVVYVPVHGGISWAQESKDGSMVYGYDCAHYGDDKKPETRDRTWLAQQCEQMARGIEVAKKFESRYLRAKRNKTRQKVILEYYEELERLYGYKATVNDVGLCAHINILFGQF